MRELFWLNLSSIIQDGNIEEIPNELPHLHDDIQMEGNEQDPDVENQVTIY